MTHLEVICDDANMQVNYQSMSRCPRVAVEFDSRSGRAVREFDNPHEARSFYEIKLRKGLNPKVIATKQNDPGGR